MFLKKVEIDHYKVLENISIHFGKKENHNVFPVISANGGGKSTLLQFIFCFLHCAFKAQRQESLISLLEYYPPITDINDLSRLVKFELEYKEENIYLEFFLCKEIKIGESKMPESNYQKLAYLLDTDNGNTLLYKSNTIIDILKEISDRTYLAIPNTQVLHFLEKDIIETLFSDAMEPWRYGSELYSSQYNLTGLFAYDFNTINLIFDVYEKARDEDFKQKLKTGEYGSKVTEIQNALNNVLTNKTVTIDGDFKQVTFKSTKSGSVLSPKDLSHGELKKLAIYIWLKAKTTENSIILMDEVDMGLHPNWQHDIYNDLQKWSAGSQFLLATHSPQIISKAFYKNLVVITPTETGATAEQFNEAPIESDLNTVVKTIMGGEYVPKELLDLRAAYRILFDNNKTETKEAIDVKNKMLAYESENSSFFQGLKFEMQFR